MSPRIRVDLTQVDTFEQFPDGNYLFEILGATSDNDSIKWKARVVEGEHEGKIIQHFCSLKPAALWNLKALCDAVGLDYTDDGFDTDDAEGALFYADVYAEEYEGRTYMKLDPSSFASHGEEKVHEGEEPPF